MAINKNFVVKNGLEVATNLIVADSSTNRVGIGSTRPRIDLDVRGSFASTNSYTSGVSTVFTEFNVGTNGEALTVLGIGGSIGIGTQSPKYLLEINSPVNTGQTALYVRGDSNITGNITIGGDINIDDINSDQIVSNTISVAVAGTITKLDATSAGIVSAYIQNITGNNLNYTGFATVTGNLKVTGITSTNSFYIDNTQVISSARELQNIVSMDATTASTIETVIQNAPNIFTDLSVPGISTLGVTTTTQLTARNLNVSGISSLGTLQNLFVTATGISTLGIVNISSGVITATTGIVTYYGDGQFLRNIVRGAGIGITGTILGYGATVFDFRGSGIGTVTTGSGIGTIFVETVGSRVSISTTPPSNASSKVGDLWYSSILGRTFIYYDEIALGVGSSSFWIDAAPFNMSVLSSIDNIILSPKTVNAPSIGFTTDTSTGIFSPSFGQVTIVSTGSSVLNVNPNGINVTGVTTSSGGFSGNVVGALLGNVTGNVTGNVSGNVNGNINSSGISTVADLQSTNINVTGIVTSNTFVGQLNSSGVSTVANLRSTNINVTGIVTANTFVGQLNSSGVSTVANLRSTNINVTGIVTANTFVGQLNSSGVSTVANLRSTNINVTGITTTAILNVGTGGTVITTTGIGSVGIGTTNPSYTLDVFGNTRVGINTSQGVILTSPDGTRYRLFVENGGTLKTIAI